MHFVAPELFGACNENSIDEEIALSTICLHLLGMDHEQLTYHHRSREMRLTDVAGKVLDDVLS